jgi:ATP-dependent helicase/nuclease subunit A
MTMLLPPDHQSRQDALDMCHSIIAAAPAGSGKTFILVMRFLKALALCNDPEEVLAITFTNKATAEMQERVMGALCLGELSVPPLSEHERGLWEIARAALMRDEELGWGLLKNPSRLRIMTIDRLNASLSAQLPLLSGMGGAAQIEDSPAMLYREAVISLFDELEDESTDEVVKNALKYLLRATGNRLDDRLVPMLSELLARRDQWKGVLNAVDSMNMEHAINDFIQYRLSGAMAVIDASTRHQLVTAIQGGSSNELLAWAAPLDCWPDADPGEISVWRNIANTLLTSEGSLITVRGLNKTRGFPAGEAPTAAMKAVLGDIHDSGNGPRLARALDAVRKLPEPDYPEDMDQFRQALALALHRLLAHLDVVFALHSKVDFVEVAQRALKALSDEDGDEASEVLRRLDYAIKHILVDEMQDTSQGQVALLRRLTEGWEAGDGRSVFMVGDPMQSIYMFRQAEVRLFLELWDGAALTDHIPLKRVQLTTNFRSEKGVVSWFNQTFEAVFPDHADPYTSAVTFNPSDTIKDADSGAVYVHPMVGARYAEEAGKVVALVKEAQERDPEGSIAILVRGRTHLADIVPALKEAGISFAAQDIDPIAESTPVRDVIHLIQALRHPMDRIAWFGLLRASFVGVPWEDTVAVSLSAGDGPVEAGLRRLLQGATVISEEGRARIDKLLVVIDAVRHNPSLTNNLPASVETTWRALGGPDCVTAAQSEDVHTLFEKLWNYCEAGQIHNIQGFTSTLGKLFASPEKGVVQIMTIHKSKGLEFDTVIIPGLGRMPRGDDVPLFYLQSLPEGFVVSPAPMRADKKKESDGRLLFEAMGRLRKEALRNESLRLLYVGLTRAKKVMHLLGHASAPRAKDGDPVPVSSSLLSLLWPAIGQEWAGLTVPDMSTIECASAPYGVPKVHRLKISHVMPEVTQGYVPKRDKANLPSEMSIRGVERFDSSNVYAAAGSLYHYMMERIAKEGVSEWGGGRIEGLRSAMAARLRNTGVGEGIIEDVIDAVVALVGNTLASETGKWILADRPGAAVELSLAGHSGGEWSAGVVDRFFIEDETAWVIDYKTSVPSPSQSIEAFLNEEKEKYSPQLDSYKKLLAAHAVVKSALYFPAIDCMVEVEAKVGKTLKLLLPNSRP